jgi:hypothetical protein
VTALDAQLTAAFGPSDPATDALIDASIVMHRNPRARAAALAELDAEPTRLKIGVAEFARRAAVNR